jgi:hypothetical protein
MFFASVNDRALQALKEEYPDPKPGDQYSYSEIEALTEITDRDRLRRIFDRFSRFLHNSKNVVILNERGVGWYVANAEQRLDHAVDKKERAYRQTKKAVKVLGSTNRDDLPENKRRFYDHHMLSLSRHAQAYLEDKKALKMLPPAKVERNS